jgi:tryptophan-rich sensory protein
VTRTVLIAVLAAVAVALSGGLLTRIGPWYWNLRKPSWQPPDWLFGPAWTLIFALAALSGVLAWNNAPDTDTRTLIVGLFGANGALNVAWSALFFTLRRPDWALIEVAFLWLSIAALIAAVFPVSRPGAWALVPYLLWVSFASVLNLAIVKLNRPFKEA